MGPTTDGRLQRDVERWKRQHPQAIVKSPKETRSGKWEVSLPASATIAFDNASTMLLALAFVSAPDEERA